MNMQNKYGKTPLMHASVLGRTDVVKYLIENKADLNIPDKNGVTAFMLASGSYHADIEFLKFLIDVGADTKGMTIVEWASSGWLEKVKESLKNKQDINLKNMHGQTPLIAAILKEHLDIITLLVESGADLTIKEDLDRTALMIASEIGNLDIVKLLVLNGADINCQRKSGDTALRRSLVI